ncbi:uncharacterized protein LOC142344550 [Convolutriloba macropyga]|uniref:uncharacterized protein LOC142344550 n=1 Tax=Convolutriloba macropyga TaxID=536237 RepID=UPI003F51EE60
MQRTTLKNKTKLPPLAGIPSKNSTQITINNLSTSLAGSKPKPSNAGVIHFAKHAQSIKSENSSSIRKVDNKTPQIVSFPTKPIKQPTNNPLLQVTEPQQQTPNNLPVPANFHSVASVTNEGNQDPSAESSSPAPENLMQQTIRRLSQQSGGEPSRSSSPVPQEQNNQNTEDEEEKFDVMISYSHQDMDLMRYIKDALKNEGLKVWVDEEGLGAGVDFLSKIGKAIVISTCFLQILTDSSVVSKYCKDELSLAYISNKPLNVICSSDPDDLFAQMDFGQKLTLAPHKNKFVEITDLRLKKSQVEFMCKQIKNKIANLLSETDATDSMTASLSVQNDMKAETFWDLYIPGGQSCNWPEFVQLFMVQFGHELESRVPITDQHWLLSIFKSELCDESSDNPDSVTLQAFKDFCKPANSRSEQFVWESVEKYAREQLAIKAVFAIDSSVRLDAIENLSKFKSAAVQEALLDLLRDPDANVRSIAALSLAKVSFGYDTQGSPTARVAKLLKDKDRLVRESACVALGRMKAEDQIEKLISVWRNDVISVVRDAALLALELIGGDEATRAIYVTRVLSDEIKALTT